MFENIKNILDRYENVVTHSDLPDEEYDFLCNFELYMAIALRDSLSEKSTKVLGKILVDMEG